MEPRTSVTKAANDGQWRVVLSPPKAALRPFIVGPYVGWSESTERPVRRREIPVLFVPVILCFRSSYQINGTRLTSFLAGAHGRHTIVESIGTVECLQFNLTHDAALRLLRQPMSELADRVVPVSDILASEAEELIEQLGNTDDWLGRFDYLEAFLARRLFESTGVSPDVRQCLAMLAQTDGKASMRELAHSTGLSPKRLIQRFRSEVGLPPKTVARIYRFNRAVELMCDSSDTLAAIADDAGYYDQAHFNRDFLEFAGLPPLQFIRERDSAQRRLTTE